MDKILADAWLATMKANCVAGRYKLLPSEAAKLVGAAFHVEPHQVLVAIYNTRS